MNIGIVGLGLMGGSLGRALVKRGVHKVFAADTDPEAMLKGALIGAYDEELRDDNAGMLDILVLSIVPSAMKDVMNRYLPRLKAGCVVTDVAGVKRPVVALMRSMKEKYPDLEFAGGHPMAGREFSGVAHSTATLYEKATVLLVGVGTSLEALTTLKNMYLGVGAEGVVMTTAEEHDSTIAYTSQLAHVVSAAYVLSPVSGRHYGFSAGSFRDMTRVAKLNPDMWTELMSENADNLADEISGIRERLLRFETALKNRDERALREFLENSNEIKNEIESGRNKKLSNVINQV